MSTLVTGKCGVIKNMVAFDAALATFGVKRDGLSFTVQSKNGRTARLTLVPKPEAEASDGHEVDFNAMFAVGQGQTASEQAYLPSWDSDYTSTVHSVFGDEIELLYNEYARQHIEMVLTARNGLVTISGDVNQYDIKVNVPNEVAEGEEQTTMTASFRIAHGKIEAGVEGGRGGSCHNVINSVLAGLGQLSGVNRQDAAEVADPRQQVKIAHQE